MGGWFSMCTGGGSQGGSESYPSLVSGAPVPAGEISEWRAHVENLKKAQREAWKEKGDYTTTRAFVKLLLITPEEVFARGMLHKPTLTKDAMTAVDHALSVEGMKGNLKGSRSVDLSIDRANLLWYSNLLEEALTDLKLSFKTTRSEDILKVMGERLRSMRRDNDVNALCKEYYPMARTQEEKEMFFRAFYEYTTLSDKVLYEWAHDEAEGWLEKNRGNIQRGSISRKLGEKYYTVDVGPTSNGVSQSTPPSLNVPQNS